MKYLLLILLVQSLVFAQTIEEYEKQIESIKDEKLKDAVRQKIAQKIADQATPQSPGPQLPTENTYVPPAEVEVVNDKLNFVIGLNGGASTVELGDLEMEISTAVFEIGAAQYFGNHRLRYTLLYHDQEVETFSDERETVKLSDTDYTMTYTGTGLGLGYSYFVSKKVGFGGYINYAEGEFEICEDFGSCIKDDTSLFEFGARVDFRFSAWSPFISVGSSNYTDSSGDSIKGSTVYVGLLNFEF